MHVICSAYFIRTDLIIYHNMPWTGENTEFPFDKYLQIFCIHFLFLGFILLQIALITDISPFVCRSGFALIQTNGYNKLVCMFKHSHCWITGTKIKYSKNNGTKKIPILICKSADHISTLQFRNTKWHKRLIHCVQYLSVLLYSITLGQLPNCTLLSDAFRSRAEWNSM
jgi:hypothetical protein